MTSTASEIDLAGGRGADVALARRLLAYLGAHKRLFALALLLYPLGALSVVIPPFLVREILDVVIPGRDLGLLHLFAGLYLGALFLEYASGFASLQAMSVLGQRAMRTLRSDLFAKVQKLPAAYFDRTPSGRILTRLTNDVEALSEVFATGAVTVLGDIITVAAVLGMMFWLDAKLTLFAFLVVPPLVALV
ncbi:MAG: ABC transporter ATP-binding protein, partial [Deltaproteobacteria bacterium]|nr:ABC transporter ATP-binding protein [Deltaproteobacteria bacterium]